MLHIQLALIVGLVVLAVYYFYNKKKVNQLSEELLDKKIVINELAEHASKIEKEINSVGEVKPIKTAKTKKTASSDKMKKELKKVAKTAPKVEKKATKPKTAAKPKKTK